MLSNEPSRRFRANDNTRNEGILSRQLEGSVELSLFPWANMFSRFGALVSPAIEPLMRMFDKSMMWSADIFVKRLSGIVPLKSSLLCSTKVVRCSGSFCGNVPAARMIVSAEAAGQ